MTLSRRAFLQLSGVTLAAAALPDLPVRPVAAAPAMPTSMGRALRAAPVHDRPALAAPLVDRLWPDAVRPVNDLAYGWFALPEGYVRQRDLQPMLPYTAAAATPAVALPAWLHVVAPVAPVRAWAGSELIRARIGYGGVLCALDRLVDDAGAVWYAVGSAPEAEPLGWTLAAHWAAVEALQPAMPMAHRELQLDAARRALIARETGRVILRAPLLAPAEARLGSWTLSSRQPALPDHARPGAAWALHAGPVRLCGAYWHNDFGAAGPGDDWQVMPWVARWLYDWLPDGAAIRVR